MRKTIVSAYLTAFLIAAPPLLGQQPPEPVTAAELHRSFSAADFSAEYLGQTYTLSEVSTERAVELSEYDSPAGHAARLRYADPEIGSISFSVDHNGVLRGEDGLTLWTNIGYPIWNSLATREGPVIPDKIKVKRARGDNMESFEVSLGETPLPATRETKQDCDDASGLIGGRAILHSLAQFSASLQKASKQNFKGFHVQVNGTALQGKAPSGDLTKQGWFERFMHCVGCAAAVVGYIGAVASLTLCATIIACGFAIMMFVSSGLLMAYECGLCFD